MNEEVINTENQEEVDEYTYEEPKDLVPTESEESYDDDCSVAGTAAGLAVIASAVVGLGVGATKLSQKIYEKHCNKAGKPVQCREKFYQLWRPKAPKVVKEKNPEALKDAEIVDADCEEVSKDV